MTARNVILMLSVTAAILAVGWFGRMGGSQRLHGNRIISEIEHFRTREGHLPDPGNSSLMRSLGFEWREGWHPEFESFDGSAYRLTFFDGFDGPYWYYESKSNQWTQRYPTGPTMP